STGGVVVHGRICDGATHGFSGIAGNDAQARPPSAEDTLRDHDFGVPHQSSVAAFEVDRALAPGVVTHVEVSAAELGVDGYSHSGVNISVDIFFGPCHHRWPFEEIR